MTKHRTHGKPRQDWQSLFVSDLRAVARAHPDTFPKVVRGRTLGDWITSLVTLRTTSMVRGAGGLSVQPEEQVEVCIPETSMLPPRVLIDHDRFDGFPHVLDGDELCIYLEPSREWDPFGGAQAFLHRLFCWFEDAVAGRFDPETALYHPVGGRAHIDDDTPMMVCREEIGFDRTTSFAHLAHVSPTRLDLLADDDGASTTERILAVRAPEALQRGPGVTVSEVFKRLGEAGWQAAKARDVQIQRQLKRQTGSDYGYILIGVPRPDGHSFYPVVGRLPLAAIRQNPARATGSLPIEWCAVSDERPSVATRRDQTRPTHAFQGRRVAVLGCGGLGSWLAEFIVRATPASIALYDYAAVTGGLLVRQNYTDADISHSKAEALKSRILAISPGMDVAVNVSGGLDEHLLDLLRSEDGVVIDATVNRAVAQVLETVVPVDQRLGLHAQVATDVAAGSLGLVAVATQGLPVGPLTLDEAAGVHVKQLAKLEPYLTFWEPRVSDELIPTRAAPTRRSTGRLRTWRRSPPSRST